MTGRYIPRHRRLQAPQPDPRAALWVAVVVAVARSDNAVEPSVPAKWADEALAAYDERFKGAPKP